jgi:hypothetical protein
MSSQPVRRMRSGGLSSSAGARSSGPVPIFDDVWWAWGTTRFMPGVTFPRNMFVVRERGELVVFHPVMLPEEEQKKLDALGKVRHIVRLGAFHGMDDAKYVARYAPKVWAPPDVDVAPTVKVDVELRPGGELPLEGATLIDFETSCASELVLHVPRHGGTLFTCDSVQSWDPMPDGLSFLGKSMAKMMGFAGRACIGPGWRKQCEPKDGAGFAPTFRRILELDFRHVLGGHGAPIRDTAKDDLRAAVARIYG